MINHLSGTLLILILFTSCKTSSEFTGFSYDPPDVTNTNDKVIYPQQKRIIGVGTPRVWISNEFEGARMNDFFISGTDTFTVVIEPENSPINRSPWYSFNLWSDSSRSITLALHYVSGTHRYIPKITQGEYTKIRTDVSTDSSGTAYLDLDLNPAPTQVSAHYTKGILFSDLQSIFSEYTLSGFITDTAGFSHQLRPIFMLYNKLPEEEEVSRPALVLMSRQHPPEVSGYRVFLAFMDRIAAEDDLATDFRETFAIYAFPIVNPDGVVNGHWRHNTGGVDLNRDWSNFRQPETRAVRDGLLRILKEHRNEVVYGIDFHSTNENIFYPIDQEIVTKPDDISQRWYPVVDSLNRDLPINIEAFDTSSPIAKNWLYHTFGADALTFEVDDELTEDEIRQLGTSAAESLMTLLINIVSE